MYGGHAYAIGLGNLSHALAFNDTGINAKPLRFGQSVQRVPQIAETLHALQQLLRGRLGKAGRVFDPIITVEGILGLIADYPPLVGSLIQLVGPQLGGHFIGNFDIFIMGVSRVKVLQIDSSHYIFLRSDFCCGWTI